MSDVRCSSLPLVMKCAQAMGGEMDIKEWFVEAELGTAVHEAQRREVLGLPVDLSAISVIADLYGVDKDEMGPLVGTGRRAWAELGPKNGAKVDAEKKLEAVLRTEPEEVWLTGSADVIITEEDRKAVTVIDWKTGRRDTDYREQVMGYCALALEANPTADIALAKLAWLRTNEVEAYSLTRADLPAWKARFLEQVDDHAFHPGTHCQYCPRKFNCPAREQMSRSAVAIMGTGDMAGAQGARALRELPAEQQIALYRQAKAVSGLAFDVLAEMKALVSETGPITALGVKLDVVEEGRRNLDTLKAWPILQRYLPDDQIAGVVNVLVGKAEDAVAASAGRGEKQTRKRAFFDELEAAGAVSHSTVKRLTERRG